jgi:glutamyl-tRNA(Gln) amidotransferase subunit E
MPFTFKSFEEMTPDDYAAIGFMSGLEVHQQLLTRRKLFCRCPARPYSDEYDAEVLRHMRPTLSELGEYDGTALMEKKTRKNIFYRIHHDTVCTYEFDDTPPFFPDEEALDIALELSLLFNLNLVGEMHIARKQYLDGSIPTGFQRTAILGVDGWIPYKDHKIGVRQLSLEEDACREVSDVGHDRVYLTDRLGMPLVETVTEPDMRTPQEVADVCQIIRMVCRSTGKVRTGYGACREDVNVSVRGGTRVEIKGVPQITRIPLLVYNEAMRQCALLNIRALLKDRGVTPETFKWTATDVTRAVAKTQYQPIRSAIAQGQVVKCVVLKGFAGLLNHPTQEHTIFAKEFADRVRVIACLTTLPNMVHSDTASDLLAVRDWKELRKRTQAGEQDALLLVWGPADDAQCACSEIVIRAREATQGIPQDTRQALKDGTNGFERVLPGAERMYPDTDLPPMEIAESRLSAIRSRLPMPFWDREPKYRGMGLPKDVIIPLCRSRRVDLFDRLVEELGINPVFAAVVLCQRFKAFRRAGLRLDALTEGEIYDVFKLHAAGQLAREGVVEVLARIVKNYAEMAPGESRVACAVRDVTGQGPLKAGELESKIAQAVDTADSSRFPTPEKKYRHLMGKLMTALMGRVDGKRVAELLSARLRRQEDGEKSRQGVRA